MKNKLPLLGLFFTTVIFSFANIAYRFIANKNYFSVVFFILLFSSVLTLAILVFSKKLKELRPLKKVKFIIIIGITNSITWFLMYFSITNTSIAQAVLGFITCPVFVAILSPFVLKESINRSILFSLLLALIGIILIFNPENLMQFIAPLGIISGIFVGVSSGADRIVGRMLKNDYSPQSLAFLGSFIGLLIMTPVFIFSNPSIPDTSSLAIILLISAIGITGGMTIYYSLRHIIAQNVAIILLLEPLISIAAAFLIFLEVPPPLTFLGGVLLLIADIIIIKKSD